MHVTIVTTILVILCQILSISSYNNRINHVLSRRPILISSILATSSSISSGHAQANNKPLTIDVSGMKCMGCVSRVKKALQLFDPFVSIDFESKRATLNIGGKDTATHLIEINSALRNEGDYVASVSNPSQGMLQQFRDSLSVFAPLISVVVGISLTTIYLQKATFPHLNWTLFMRHFMGLFFITFSAFKLVNLRGFVDAFSQYDILTRRYKLYGYLYPFLEFALGACYLSKYRLLLSATGTNMVTVALMTLTSAGVLGALRTPGVAPLKCACLGGGFKLPMTQVTLMENVVMIAMSVFMLFSGVH